MRSPLHVAGMIALASLVGPRDVDDYELRDEPEPRRAREPAPARRAAKVQTKTGNRERARRLRQQASTEAKRAAARTTGAA